MVFYCLNAQCSVRKQRGAAPPCHAVLLLFPGFILFFIPCRFCSLFPLCSLPSFPEGSSGSDGIFRQFLLRQKYDFLPREGICFCPGTGNDFLSPGLAVDQPHGIIPAPFPSVPGIGNPETAALKAQDLSTDGFPSGEHSAHTEGAAGIQSPESRLRLT